MEGYGGSESTGFEQTASGRIQTGLAPGDVAMSSADKAVLRALAERVATIAGSAEMKAKRELWRKLNSLQRTRPVILCDPENGWNEIITEKQMRCTGKLARRWEMDLRKEIFWGEEMGDDKPIEAYFDVPYTVAPEDWGLSTDFVRTEEKGSMRWDGPLRDYETALRRIHPPKIEIDRETTGGCLDVARDVFEGILTVRLKGTWWWSLGVTMPAVFLRGLTNFLYDFEDHPDELKELLRLISAGHMAKLDYLEENGVLSLNNDSTYIGSGGHGITDELPQPDFAGKVRCADMWGFTDSQETVNVSPRMYEEFVFPHEQPIMQRFGLTCYGCCEPLHDRWDVVKRHHNLRRVSCSPWCDWAKMAGYLEDKYIFSMKPNPACIAVPEIDEDRIRKDIREGLAVARGCVVEIIMKDNHTIGNRPENVVAWCRIAKEEAGRAWRG